LRKQNFVAVVFVVLAAVTIRASVPADQSFEAKGTLKQFTLMSLLEF
jgi:hypothetical protein